MPKGCDLMIADCHETVCYIKKIIINEPTSASGWWARMHCFLSVCLSARKMPGNSFISKLFDLGSPDFIRVMGVNDLNVYNKDFRDCISLQRIGTQVYCLQFTKA